jgi:ABC-type uncharacterized transport system permease subunit
MARLTILCFAGTYALALFCDLARPVLRPAARWAIVMGMTALGLAVHTLYLANLAGRDHAIPVTSVRESLLALAWVLAVTDLYLVLRAPKTSAIGLFVLPVVVGLSAFAGLTGARPGEPRWERSVQFWGGVHGGFLLMGAAFTCVAFVFGLMYLVQANRLKHKRPNPRGFALPSLEQSERWNWWAITVAFPLLTFGLVIGVVLVPLSRGSGFMLAWTDPKVLSAAGLWLVFAVLLNARFRPEMRGRRVMLLTVIAFAFMVFTWVGVDLLLPTAHGTALSPEPAGRRP